MLPRASTCRINTKPIVALCNSHSLIFLNSEILNIDSQFTSTVNNLCFFFINKMYYYYKFDLKQIICLQNVFGLTEIHHYFQMTCHTEWFIPNWDGQIGKYWVLRKQIKSYLSKWNIEIWLVPKAVVEQRWMSGYIEWWQRVKATRLQKWEDWLRFWFEIWSWIKTAVSTQQSVYHLYLLKGFICRADLS